MVTPHERETAMTKDQPCPTTGTAADFLPRKITLKTLTTAAQGCRGCNLYCNATQAVFGAGPRHASLLLVGEQPGDQEDKAGRPFVGPAGRVLDESLQAAGISRDKVYVTNAVKHFKWEPRGKRRLHAKPTWTEIVACRPWLMAELTLIQPDVVVCLGATAAQSLMGKTFRLTQHRQEVMHTAAGQVLLATVHPSSLLRIPDHDARVAARAAFIDDLKFAAQRAKQPGIRKR